jgi:benzodiazapine receptor
MYRRLSLFAFVVFVTGGGLLIGYLTTPGAWYAGLAKPAFTPPGWVFGAVWTPLYVLIAIAGWRAARRGPAAWPIKLWWAQLVLNFSWSPIFFSAHRIDLGLVVILLLLVPVLAFIATAWRVDRLAAGLFVPYAAWVMFAFALNLAIFLMN